MTAGVEEQLNDLDRMIVHEKMQVALGHQNEAWAEGIADGIEPEILADAAIAMAFGEIVRLYGEEDAEAMLEALKERLQTGEFSPDRKIQ